MHDIFADGVRTAVLVNGVVRIELTRFAQVKPEQKTATLEPSATLLIPAASFRDFAVRVADTLRRIEEAQRQRAEGQAGAAPAAAPAAAKKAGKKK